MNGAVYVAYGYNACAEARESIASLRRHNRLPITIVSDVAFDGVTCVKFDKLGPGARWAKLNVDRLVAYDNVAYLDADTRVNGSLDAAFAMLNNGWDLLIAPSRADQQGGGLFHHVSKAEKAKTLEEVGNPFPLQLQCGVIFFRRERCARLFEAWRDEWLRWKGADQAAFLRALRREPVRVALLGRPWNGGGLVEHRFGRARDN